MRGAEEEGREDAPRRVAVRLDRHERLALHAELLNHMSGIGDVHLLLESGDHEGARRLADAFVGDLAMLDALGWAEEDPRETFELALPREELAPVVGRLCRDAAGFLAMHLARPREEEALAE